MRRKEGRRPSMALKFQTRRLCCVRAERRKSATMQSERWQRDVVLAAELHLEIRRSKCKSGRPERGRLQQARREFVIEHALRILQGQRTGRMSTCAVVKEEEMTGFSKESEESKMKARGRETLLLTERGRVGSKKKVWVERQGVLSSKRLY